MTIQLIEFSTEDERLQHLFYKNEMVLFIEYDDSNNSDTARVFLHRKEDHKHDDLMTIELTGDFYDFYLTNLYNPKYTDMDLRVVWFMNRHQQYKYNFKMLRPTYYECNRLRMCEHMEYQNRDSTDIKVQCLDTGIFKIKDHYWCAVHIP